MARCLYLKMQTLRHAYKRALNDPQYIILPSNISELNDYMCGPMNRKAISVVSVLMDSVHRLHHLTTMSCMACSNCTASRYYGVPLFIFTKMVPTTFFYLMFLFF